MSSAKDRFIQSLNQHEETKQSGQEAVLAFQGAVERLGHLIHNWLNEANIDGQVQVRVAPTTISGADGTAQTVSYTLNFRAKHVTFEPLYISAIGAAGVLSIKGLRYEAQLILTPGGEWWVTPNNGAPIERRPLDSEAFFGLLEHAR